MNSAQAGLALGGIGGGSFDVATWNNAARLLENSGHGGFPVTNIIKIKRFNEMAK
jgi:hypothetical protein